MEINAYFEGFEASHFRTGIKMLRDRYNQCIIPDMSKYKTMFSLKKKVYSFMD